MTSDACSWCGTMNPAEEKVCKNLRCQHDAHVPRVDCGCYQCTCFSVRAAGIPKVTAIAAVTSG